MGDNGRLYVDADVVPVYRSLVSHADLVVPNLFELEYVPSSSITVMIPSPFIQYPPHISH